MKHYYTLILWIAIGLFSPVAFAQPTAADDMVTVTEDADVAIDVTANDDFGAAGPDGALPVKIIQSAAHGSAVVYAGDFIVTYVPNPNYNGTDSFTYQIKDANGATTTAVVSITILDDGTDVPTAADDYAVTQEDVPVTIPIADNDNPGGDGYGGYYTVTGVSQMGGTVVANSTPNPLFLPIDDTITYTPAPNFNGVDYFTYTLHDSNGDTSTATVWVTVDPDAVGDLPTALDDQAITFEDTPVDIAVLANDSFGSSGPGTTPIIVSPAAPEMTPLGGMVSVNDNGTPGFISDDTITYTPNLDIYGVDSFTYTITDAIGNTATATVTVIINAEGAPPLAVDDQATTNVNTPVDVAVLANDDFSQLNNLAPGTAQHGTLTLNTNGTPQASDDTIIYTPENGFIGTDTFTYVLVSNVGIDGGQVTVQVLPFNNIVLTAFADVNGDGIQNEDEINFPNVAFHYEQNNDGIAHDVVSSSGQFGLVPDAASDTYDFSCSVTGVLSNYFAVTTAPFQDVTATGESEFKFAIAVTNPVPVDVNIQLTPQSAPRPGFIYQNLVSYRNNGPMPVSGTITFNSSPVVTVVGIAPNGATTTANGFTYAFSNLAPFETRYIAVSMSVPTIPTVALGDLLTNTVNIAVADDNQLSNNNAFVAQAIVGSYDPNDITESHGPKIVYADFTSEDYLYYTIRFENTGTANAENIRVESVLFPGLDETSIEMLDASAAYTMERTGNGLVWNFNNVQLPPSEENTQIGHGYLTYRIKPTPGYAIGDIIPNSASIYFDFNPAIETNTFETEFVTALSVADLNKSTFTAWPNPAHDLLHIRGTASISGITVFNMLGQKVLAKTTNASDVVVDLSGLPAGVYNLEVKGVENTQTVRIVRQ